MKRSRFLNGAANDTSSKSVGRLLRILIAAMVPLLGAISVAAQQAAPLPGVQARMVVTVEARHGSEPPVIHREDAMVYEGRDRDQVTDWIPVQGSRAALQLFVLIDDAADTTALGSQLQEISKFINAQPATTAIGVAYMRNGSAAIAQNLTTDHAQAAKALRLPLGDPGASASPYFSVADLVKRWPETQAPRELLMITDGIDRFYGSGPSDPYVDETISQAQRAGIIIFSIYTPSAGHFGHSFWRANWGQNYLSQLSDETGGESYYLGTGAPVSFGPYLDDLASRLKRQYLLSFLAKPEDKAGLRKVKLRTEVPNAELVAADRVYVPAGK
jgi:hypothetical protein